MVVLTSIQGDQRSTNIKTDQLMQEEHGPTQICNIPNNISVDKVADTQDYWNCAHCTLRNDACAMNCEICYMLNELIEQKHNDECNNSSIIDAIPKEDLPHCDGRRCRSGNKKIKVQHPTDCMNFKRGPQRNINMGIDPLKSPPFSYHKKFMSDICMGVRHPKIMKQNCKHCQLRLTEIGRQYCDSCQSLIGFCTNEACHCKDGECSLCKVKTDSNCSGDFVLVWVDDKESQMP